MNQLSHVLRWTYKAHVWPRQANEVHLYAYSTQTMVPKLPNCVAEHTMYVSIQSKRFPQLTLWFSFRPEYSASISVCRRQESVCRPIMEPFTFSTLKRHDPKSMAYKYCRNISPANGHFVNSLYHKDRHAFGMYWIVSCVFWSHPRER